MKRINAGFRLPPPPGCPKAIYDIMIKCWYVCYTTLMDYMCTHNLLFKLSISEFREEVATCKMSQAVVVSRNTHIHRYVIRYRKIGQNRSNTIIGYIAFLFKNKNVTIVLYLRIPGHIS